MRVMILHTPADSAEPGLLLHLQEILRCGSIEVETVVLGEAGLPLPYYSAGGTRRMTRNIVTNSVAVSRRSRPT